MTTRKYYDLESDMSIEVFSGEHSEVKNQVGFDIKLSSGTEWSMGLGKEDLMDLISHLTTLASDIS